MDDNIWAIGDKIKLRYTFDWNCPPMVWTSDTYYNHPADPLKILVDMHARKEIVDMSGRYPYMLLLIKE